MLVAVLLQFADILLDEHYQVGVGRFAALHMVHLFDMVDVLKILAVIDKCLVVAVNVSNGKDAGCRVAPDGWCADGGKGSKPVTI